MLLDANVLLYAGDARSRFNARASAWLEAALAGDRRVGLPWQTIGAFLRISTHPRVTDKPLSLPDAQLAALAIEHGLTVISADSDFARFDELSWQNPLAGG